MKIFNKTPANNPAIEKKISLEQMQMLYQSLPYNLVFHVSVSFILCAVLWAVADRESLLVWWLLMAIWSLVRLGSYAYYRICESGKYSVRFWNVVYGSGSVIAGLLWGLAGVYLTPHEIMSYELFVGFIIAGMAMGAVPILSSVRSVYLGFSTAAEIPYIAHIFIHEGTLYTAVGIIHCLFLVLMILMALRMHKLTRESLLLRFYNTDLVEKLQDSNELLVDEVDSHRQTEVKLRENEQRLVALANATSEGIVLHQDSKIIEVNQAMVDMTGFTNEELLASNVEALFAEGCRSEVLSYIQSPTSKPLEAQACGNNDYCIPIEIRAGYVPFQGQHVAYVVLRDITHFKELLKSQELGRKKAEEADRSKTEFLAAVSHELRTPLNAVMGFTQLLQDTELTAEQEEYLSMTYQSAEQLLNLINDLLDLSRIESGHFDLDLISFNLLDELNDILSLVSIKLADSGNMIKVDFADDLPKELVTDPLRLRQILLNLLGNAIKFTAEGGIEFSVYKKDQHIYFSVKDSGKGIPEDKLEYIFGKFNQVDSSISRTHGGVGLGLAISKRLAESMGGDISVESKLNEGAIFRVELPLVESLECEEKQEVLPVVPSEREIKYEPSEGLNILLVEDDKTNQVIALAMLKKYGHQVTVAENGQQGVEFCLDENSFDLILMDIQMPVMDGLAATQRLRESGITIPIIAMTANAMTGDREEYIKAGMTDYISKPIYKESLKQILDKYN